MIIRIRELYNGTLTTLTFIILYFTGSNVNINDTSEVAIYLNNMYKMFIYVLHSSLHEYCEQCI